MKKVIGIGILLMFLLSTLAIAASAVYMPPQSSSASGELPMGSDSDEGNLARATADEEFDTSPAEPQSGFLARLFSGQGFTFVSPQCETQPSDTRYRADYKEGVKPSGTTVTKFGVQCEVGEFIELVSCSKSGDASGNECVKIFSQDYKKESTDDRLDVSLFYGVSWFDDVIDNRYVGYNCKACDPVPCLSGSGPLLPGQEYCPEDQQPEYPNGYFSEIITPKNAFTGETVYVEGDYVVTKGGRFVLEANINQESRQPFSIVSAESSSSACDGSAFYSGTFVEADAGDVVRFKLYMEAPSKEGKYTIDVYTWTDCAVNGGQQIRLESTNQIDILDRAEKETQNDESQPAPAKKSEDEGDGITTKGTTDVGPADEESPPEVKKTSEELDTSCTVDKMVSCQDGSEVTTATCEDGEAKPTGNKCEQTSLPVTAAAIQQSFEEQPIQTVGIVVMSIAILVVSVLIIMNVVRKRRK